MGDGSDPIPAQLSRELDKSSAEGHRNPEQTAGILLQMPLQHRKRVSNPDNVLGDIVSDDDKQDHTEETSVCPPP